MPATLVVGLPRRVDLVVKLVELGHIALREIDDVEGLVFAFVLGHHIHCVQGDLQRQRFLAHERLREAQHQRLQRMLEELGPDVEQQQRLIGLAA